MRKPQRLEHWHDPFGQEISRTDKQRLERSSSWCGQGLRAGGAVERGEKEEKRTVSGPQRF